MIKYYKELDGVRAVAVFLVIVCHWFPPNWMVTQPLLTAMGAAGVNTFFVLSGYLISSILIQNRIDSDKSGINKYSVLKNFYVRRALRIFPIYYLMIAVLYFNRHNLDVKLNQEVFYSLTYTINFYFYKMEYWGLYTTHFWSLAVEEQFYLLWPWIILFLNRKYLVHAIGGFIVVGMFTQVVHGRNEYGLLPTYTCFDSFGLGALLSWVMTMNPAVSGKFYRILSLTALLVAGLVLAQAFYGTLVFLPQRTLHSIIALWVISSIVIPGKKTKRYLAGFLNFQPLVFAGKISYGLYLYHLCLPYFTSIWLRVKLNRLLPPVLNDHQFYFIFMINLALLICISWLSWILIEGPILRLKKYFSYQGGLVLQ
jgi:peptidoglycan/LPS O-acetylase OafA/YrhL